MLAAVVLLGGCLALLSPSALRAWSAGLLSGGRALWAEGQALPGLVGDVTSGHVQPGGDRAGQHEYWQVGLAAGPGASHATGMRTTIVTRLPQRVAPNTTNYFWIGSYLADSSFIQLGYYIPWYDQSDAGWFYCAFTSSQQKGPCVYGPAGSVGANGTAHTYTLAVASAPGSGQAPSAFVWRASVDGAPVGQFGWTSGDTGANTPTIFAESSGFAPHAATSTLGPVDFPLPIQARPAGQLAYVPAAHLRPVYDAPDICPPYGIGTDATGGALLGSGLPCSTGLSWLW